VLKRIFECKRKEVSKLLYKIYIVKSITIYSSQNIRVIKSRNVMWAAAKAEILKGRDHFEYHVQE
jgi:hypothetical protein